MRTPPYRFLSRSAPILLALISALLSLQRAAAAGPTDQHDRWYVLRIKDQRAGWLHDKRDNAGERITSRSTLHIELKRGDQAVVVEVEAEFVETGDGKPVSMKVVQTLGSAPTTEQYTFRPDAVDVVSTVAGARKTSRRDLPAGNWLTPAAAARFIAARLEAGAKEFTVRAIDPTSGVDPVLTTTKVLERTTIEALGKTVPAIKWRTSTDSHPDLDTTEFVDEFGVPIRSETHLGDLKVDIVLADRDLAQSKLDPPELLVSTLVTPDKPIANPRAATRATYRLTLKDGGRISGLPFGAGQSLAYQKDGSVTVVVDPSDTSVVPDHDESTDAQLKSSALLTSDDAGVKRLAAQAIRGAGPGVAERGEAMRRFVHSYIRAKNLGVGFASAAEVARTRTGDCTEHAVLLAAMLRAEKIPARVVSGLIYADEFEGKKGIFGYHMWAQAFLGGGRWLNLDATLPDNSKFDATHIALATTDLADGETYNALVSLVPLLGNLKIAVEKVEY